MDADLRRLLEKTGWLEAEPWPAPPLPEAIAGMLLSFWGLLVVAATLRAGWRELRTVGAGHA